jgi:hypothetical protein
MKTSELIGLLANDQTRQPSPARALALGMLPGVLLAIALFLLVSGLRPDILAALGTPRFVFKLIANVTLLVASTGLVLRLVLPGGRSGSWALALAALLAALLVGVGIELLLLPRGQWWVAAHGHNSLWCLTVIPMLAIAPLATALQALRQAAPDRPAVAGAVAGLVASGFASSLYGLHCTDDSPLFVALWYPLAIAMVVAVGALLGNRVLRW